MIRTIRCVVAGSRFGAYTSCLLLIDFRYLNDLHQLNHRTHRGKSLLKCDRNSKYSNI